MDPCCCIPLKNLLDDAGRRGVSALVRHTDTGINFLLQSRGIDFTDEPKLHPVDLDLSINISCDIKIRFCPFCGRRLQELIDTSPEYFDKLAQEHGKFHSRS